MPFLLGLWVVFGVIGYRRAEKLEQTIGRGPWGGSPLLWGIVCFLIGIFGVVLLLIAVTNTEKQYRANSNAVVWTAGPYSDPRFAPPPAPVAPQWAPPANQWAPPPAPQWSPPPPPQWTPQAAPPPAPGGPNVGGSDFIPRH